MMTHIFWSIYICFVDAYSAYGEYNWTGKLFVADLALEKAAVLKTISVRNDSSQNCTRSLGFQPSCSYLQCRLCSSFCVMLTNVGARGTIGIVGQQLLDQLPQIDNDIRYAHYGHCSYMQFNREMINQGYGMFTF